MWLLLLGFRAGKREEARRRYFYDVLVVFIFHVNIC